MFFILQDNHRQCYTCKLVLPASKYYCGNIVKYYRCRDCENKRLALHRDKARYVEVDGVTHFSCPECHTPIKEENIYRRPCDAWNSYHVCKHCTRICRLRRTGMPDERTGLMYKPGVLGCHYCNDFLCRGRTGRTCLGVYKMYFCKV